MSEIITEAEAVEFTREEAIAALAHSPSAADRRMAAVLAAGPAIKAGEESKLRTLKLRRAPVERALAQLGSEVRAQRIEEQRSVAELAGVKL